MAEMNIIDQLLSLDKADFAPKRKVHKMTLNKIGQVFEFPIKQLSAEEACRTKDSMAVFEQATGMMMMDSFEARADVVIFACPEVFQNKSVLQHFGVVDSRDLVSVLFTLDELRELESVIKAFSGISDDDEAVLEIADEELKNS